MLLDLRGTNITGKELEHVSTRFISPPTKTPVPFDPQSPFITSGLRIGTPAITSRGFGKKEMRDIAGFIADVAFDFDAKKDEVNAAVAEMCKRFPIYED